MPAQAVESNSVITQLLETAKRVRSARATKFLPKRPIKILCAADASCSRSAVRERNGYKELEEERSAQ